MVSSTQLFIVSVQKRKRTKGRTFHEVVRATDCQVYRQVVYISTVRCRSSEWKGHKVTACVETYGDLGRRCIDPKVRMSLEGQPTATVNHGGHSEDISPRS